MAFKNGLSERLEELRFTSPRSPPSESPFSSYPSPPRGQTSFMPVFQPAHDVRANLHRRFTTDASKFPSWTAFNQQPTPLPDSLDLLSSVSASRSQALMDPITPILRSAASVVSRR